MKLTHGHVINLKRRPERLQAFLSQPWVHSLFRIEPFTAVDGSTFVMDESRVNPWNFVHLSDAKCRAVVACCLSHLHVWQRIAHEYAQGKHNADEPVAIFEDDAVLLPRSLDEFTRAWEDLTMPPNVSFLWLNSPQLDPYPEIYTGKNELVQFKTCTTEAYLLRPSFAARLVSAIEHDLGAVDAHMCAFLNNCGANMGLSYPLFHQRDRSDTDIQRH